MLPTPSPDAALESLVGEIADDFTRRHQRGEEPRLEEYTARYPELAELLSDILPAIQALSPARGPAAADTPGPSATPGSAAPVPAPTSLVDYEILAEIGRGGMGVVYQARHRTLGRIVALKMLRSHDPADLERFRSEAQAVARLQHPNVVQIFEVQEADGQPFLALEYVAGGSLAERIKGEPQPPHEAAALVQTLARAMAFAHERGLVHRDLKPGNVLLVSGGVATSTTGSAPLTTHNSPLNTCTPKITDFGLAKRLDQELGQTQTGAIVGTPSYMAPEQAVAGANVGPAADIFALGAILYELITGRPPFKGPSVLETLELVRHAEPTPPSQLQPGCPRDLETICLKCLHKEPTRRYASAGLLADDVGRFLGHEPILARPVGKVERLGKWLRRRPAVAASIALAALATVVVVTLAIRLSYSWDLEDANLKLGEAVDAKEAALTVAHQARNIAEQNHHEADEARTKLDAALERERALHYLHSIALAQREWQGNRIDGARLILDSCPEDLRHWEWRYLHRQCHNELLTIRGHMGPIMALAVDPTGALIAAASSSSESEVIEWDLKLWDATSGEFRQSLVGHQGPIMDVAFSPDGALLASTSLDKTIRLWDTRTGRELRKITSAAVSRRVAFSPNGKRMAALPGAKVRLFDVDRGEELFTLPGHSSAGLALAFSRDGNRLVTAGADHVVKVWDLTKREQVCNCHGHNGLIRDVAFSPNNDRVMSCGPSGAGTVVGVVRLWEADSGKPVLPVITLDQAVTAGAFSPDASLIACASKAGAVHILDGRSGQRKYILHCYSDDILRLGFSPDGRRLITGSADRTIRVWPVDNPEFVQLSTHFPILAVALSADNTRIAFSDCDFTSIPGKPVGEIRVMPVTPASQGSLEIRPTNPTYALAFSPDNDRLAGAQLDGVHLWNLKHIGDSRFIREFGVWEMSISPDGRYLATASRNADVNPRPDFVKTSVLARARAGLTNPLRVPVPAIKIWRIADGQLLRVLPGQFSVSYSPDGLRLAGAKDKNVVLWDAATGDELRSFSGPTEPVLKVQFAAEGRRVVGFTHHQAIVWDEATSRKVATVDGLKGPAWITPDGRRIVGLHGGIKWWDVGLGRELLFLAVPEGDLQQLALSAEGHRLAASGDRKLMLWTR